MKKKIKNEMNLYEVFYILFSNKFKILIITIASILIAILFELTTKTDKLQNQKYILTFLIHPIDKFEELSYSVYNKFNLSKIDINFTENVTAINDQTYLNTLLINKFITNNSF